MGKYADLIVLENNFMQASDEALGRNSVLLTMVGGTVVRVAILNTGATAGQQVQLTWGTSQVLSSALNATDLSNGYIDITVPTTPPPMTGPRTCRAQRQDSAAWPRPCSAPRA